MKAMKGMMGGNPQMDEMMQQMEGQMLMTVIPLAPWPIFLNQLVARLSPRHSCNLLGGGRSKSSFTKSKKSKRKKKSNLNF